VIYAEGRDLIVVAPVHPGAQLLADGNIHVYGPLKGRAVAGTHGARDAQVFCLTLEAELVGVDTGYVTSDDIPPALWGGPARVLLTPDGICTVVPLSMGKRAAPAVANLARR
jgi:septum site-determining protein MinC